MARAEEPVELGEKLRFYPFHAASRPSCERSGGADQITVRRGPDRLRQDMLNRVGELGLELSSE